MSFNMKSFFRKNREAMTTKTAQVGGYSFLMSLILFGILVAVNVFVGALPSKFTSFDISAQQLYSVTSDTKVVVNNLQQDVTVYWICQSGKEDSVIEKLLDVYDGMSDHLTVVKKDPDVYPTFAAQYTDDTVNNNSLVVESGDRYRYIDYNDIYETDTSTYYTTGSVSQSFNGEGKITTAINYVVTEELPKMYLLTGHGEADLSEDFQSGVDDANIETDSLSLLTVDEIPEDADAVLINSPTSDLAEEEVTMLEDYVDNGGKLLVLSGLQQDGMLTNLDSLLEYIGVSVNDGVVIEADRDYYAFSQPYILLPTIESSDITDALSENNSNVLVAVGQGLTVGSGENGYTVTSLLDTSDEAFSKVAGFSLTTYDKEDGDIDGPFSLAVSAENDNEGKLVWVASDYMVDSTYNSYSSGANMDFIMNSVSWMIGEQQAIAIRSKSLDYSYLTISSSVSMILKVWMIGIIPLVYLLMGIMEVAARRKNQ